MLYNDGDDSLSLVIYVTANGIEVIAEGREGTGITLGGEFTWQEIAEELLTQAKVLGREEAVQMGV